MPFAPIAIVGQACVLPGANSPRELFELVRDAKSAISPVPPDRWRVDRQQVVTTPQSPHPDRTWSDRGGYVSDVGASSVGDAPADNLGQESPLFRWALETCQQALAQVSSRAKIAPQRSGLILGNLAYPSDEFTQFAEQVFLEELGLQERTGKYPVSPKHRFHAGQLATKTARHLGFEGPAFCLDAACASSLYAIKLACDALHDGEQDLVLAGGVCRADDLFIHIGFCALQALSRSGRSRPFCQEADGLVPAEGAAVVALRRLEDAIADGDVILGVIRGIGLSNDGQSGGFLSPSVEGQVRAMRLAYEQSGLKPADISYVECHATGTAVGDAAELRSLTEVFAGVPGIVLGSLKSNLGHLLAAAGAAGLIKVLQSFQHRTLLPTIDCRPLRDDFQKPGCVFQVLDTPRAWDATGPRRAAVSAFGFGGTNAHLIVEEWCLNSKTGERGGVSPPRSVSAQSESIAIVALAAKVSNGSNVEDFAARVLDALPCCSTGFQPVRDSGRLETCPANPAAMEQIVLDARGLRFPPLDLKQVLPQQLLALRVAQEAFAGIAAPHDRTGVFVGMQCDAEIARYGLRWRWPVLAGHSSQFNLETLHGPLEAAGVVGAMPNIPANRINLQLNLRGPGFTVAADELSGIRALELAIRALRHHELDAAVVCASDMCCEPVHEQAAKHILPEGRVPGDGGVALVLKRTADARRDGDRILAEIASGEPGDVAKFTLQLDDAHPGLTPVFGHAHAASGLIHVAAAVVRLATGDGERRTADVVVIALGGQSATVRLTESASPTQKPVFASPPVEAHQKRSPLTFPAHFPRIDRRMLESGLSTNSSAPATQASKAAPPDPSHQVLPPAPWLPPVLAGSRETPAREIMPVRPERSRATQSIVAQHDEGVPVRTGASLRSSPGHPMSVGRSDAALHEQAWAAMMTDLSAVQLRFIEQLQTSQQQFQHLQDVCFQRVLQSDLAEGSTDELAQALLTPASLYSPSVQNDARSDFRDRTSSEPVVRSATPTRMTLATPFAADAAQGVPPKSAQPSLPDGRRTPCGPAFTRQQLEVLAGGQISSVFGPLFAQQDGYHRQVRMPEPPLLLADRVTGIDAEPGVLGQGTIWTETDVAWDSWYLQQGVMPAGLMIEAGQADLLLISWMGADFHNQDRRVYRLLGCEAEYRGRLPRPGQTLQFEIRITGHARQGDVRLFFFEYDCWVDGEVRLSVRRGQAGFFTNEELANSEGVLWSPESVEAASPSEPQGASRGSVDRESTLASTPTVGDGPAASALPLSVSEKTAFSPADVAALFAGRVRECFGPQFFRTESHVRTPVLDGRMPLFEDVPEFDPQGGPWKRGYLRATKPFQPDDWFFQGHFKNDPCMPGTLMAEGSLQCMAFVLTAFGCTLDNDGWRFEPVSNHSSVFRCRGQAIPSSRELVYEVFVEELIPGPQPTLFADILCTVDGVKAFHARRMGLRLVPDWPLGDRPELLAVAETGRETAQVDDVRGDYASLLACAWGRPSDSFGEMYRVFDGHRRAPRLPGPPYHFLSRLTRIEGARGVVQPGAWIEAEYDVPPDAWYFADNGSRDQRSQAMPFCVLQEIILQPCGWLATFCGFAVRSDEDLYFRNLDGRGVVEQDVLPETGTLRTRVTLTKASTFGGTSIVWFSMESFIGETRILRFETSFGFFTHGALANQVGLPTTPDELARFREPGDFHLDLKDRPALGTGRLRLPGPMLEMFDRVTGYWPAGGSAGLGRIRTEQTIDPAAWYFKAHFYQDPVQPGSLGVQGMLNLLQLFMLLQKLDEGLSDPRFEPLASGEEIVWKYRGQVVPTNGTVVFDVQILQIAREPAGVLAIAAADLWVDGKRIYRAERLGVRLTSG